MNFGCLIKLLKRCCLTYSAARTPPWPTETQNYAHFTTQNNSSVNRPGHLKPKNRNRTRTEPNRPNFRSIRFSVSVPKIKLFGFRCRFRFRSPETRIDSKNRNGDEARSNAKYATEQFVCHELVKLFPSLLSCGDVLWYWYYTTMVKLFPSQFLSLFISLCDLWVVALFGYFGEPNRPNRNFRVIRVRFLQFFQKLRFSKFITRNSRNPNRPNRTTRIDRTPRPIREGCWHYENQWNQYF